MHHHARLFSPDHVAVIVAIGALGCLLGAAFVISWRDSGDKLRNVLSQIEDPPCDQGTDPACRPSPPIKYGPRYGHRTTAFDDDDRQSDQNEIEP